MRASLKRVNVTMAIYELSATELDAVSAGTSGYKNEHKKQENNKYGEKKEKENNKYGEKYEKKDEKKGYYHHS